MSKERIYWIDTAKGICMIFVMISHAYPPTSWIRLFTPFFLPTFFFLSGYTFRADDGFMSFFIRKVKSLVIPMVLFSLVNGMVGVLFKGVPFTVRLLGIVIQQAGGYEFLWFFPCLFVCELIFYGIVKLCQSEKTIFIASCAVTCAGYIYVALIGYALPWQFELSCINVLFLSFGYIFKLYEEKLRNIYSKPYAFFTILILYFALCLCIDNDVNIHEERFGMVSYQTLILASADILLIRMATVLQSLQRA